MTQAGGRLSTRRPPTRPTVPPRTARRGVVAWRGRSGLVRWPARGVPGRSAGGQGRGQARTSQPARRLADAWEGITTPRSRGKPGEGSSPSGITAPGGASMVCRCLPAARLRGKEEGRVRPPGGPLGLGGETDITPRLERGVPGSTPGRGTDRRCLWCKRIACDPVKVEAAGSTPPEHPSPKRRLAVQDRPLPLPVPLPLPGR
jgi:hypothetical protein